MSETVREKILTHVRDAFRTGKTAEATDRILAAIHGDAEPVAVRNYFDHYEKKAYVVHGEPYGWVEEDEIGQNRASLHRHPNPSRIPLYTHPTPSDARLREGVGSAIAIMNAYAKDPHNMGGDPRSQSSISPHAVLAEVYATLAASLTDTEGET